MEKYFGTGPILFESALSLTNECKTFCKIPTSVFCCLATDFIDVHNINRHNLAFKIIPLCEILTKINHKQIANKIKHFFSIVNSELVRCD